MRKLTRADFLRVLGLSAATAALGKEPAKPAQGDYDHEKYAQAEYVQLYENHRIGIDWKDLPSDVDAVYYEYLSERAAETSAYEDPKKLLQLRYEIDDTHEGRQIIPDEILARFAKHKTDILLLDIMFPKLTKDTDEVLGNLALVITALLGTSVGARKLFTSDEQTTRRTVLQLLGIGAATLPAFSKFLTTRIAESGANLNSHDPFVRAARLMKTCLIPFDAIQAEIFFRDALAAIKLTTYIDWFRKTHGRPPKIATISGLNHHLDLCLDAGLETCLAIMTIYAKVYPWTIREIFSWSDNGLPLHQTTIVNLQNNDNQPSDPENLSVAAVSAVGNPRLKEFFDSFR